jgi:hypothetical protein
MTVYTGGTRGRNRTGTTLSEDYKGELFFSVSEQDA